MAIDIDEFREYYIDEDHTVRETCKYFDITYTFFRKFVVEHNLKKNIYTTGVKHERPSKEEIVKYYITENKTSDEMAQFYGVHPRTFLRWTKHYNIEKPLENQLQNMYNTNMEKYGAKTVFGTSEYREWYNDNKEVITDKIQDTMMERYGAKSFLESTIAKDVWKMGTSKTEQKIFEKLKSVYSDCVNGYKSEKYPYSCDFYIPCLDLYIEYQGFYTHGTEPYDENNPQHIEEVKKLKENNTPHNNDKLYIWTKKDPEKRETARKNGLRWIEFFTEEEFDQWFRCLDKRIVINWIESVYPKVERDKIINGIKVDVFYPSRRIAIKLRGLFWEPEQTNPRIESKTLKENGIRLVNIYDYEWINFEDNFRNFLFNVLKSRNKKLIRNDEVVKISAPELIDFLRDNHLFTDTIKGCSYCYGIYQDGELVAVSGFNDKKRGKYNFEWKRFAIKYGYMSERGIAQRFLDKFAEEHHGIVVDYQQMDRFPFSTDEEMGFTRIDWNSGCVTINLKTHNFTRHRFIREKGMTKDETIKFYGFDVEVPTAGTITWVKDV